MGQFDPPKVPTIQLDTLIALHIEKGWDECRYEEIVIGEWRHQKWENQFTNDYLNRFSVVDILNLPVPKNRLFEVAFNAAQELRRFEERDGKQWKEKWKQDLLQPKRKQWLLDKILRQIEITLEHPVPKIHPRIPTHVQPIADGFTEWVLFRNRSNVPSKGGVYLLGQFDDGPPAQTNPEDKPVIDIGMSGNSIKDRLDGFKKVAHTGRAKDRKGKSSGWTYRTDFVYNFEHLLNFEGLYAAWMEMPNYDETKIGDKENSLIKAYRMAHGRNPAICRQNLRRE